MEQFRFLAYLRTLHRVKHFTTVGAVHALVNTRNRKVARFSLSSVNTIG